MATTIENGADRPPAPGLKRTQSARSATYSRRGGDDLTAAMWTLGGPLALAFVMSAIQAASAINTCTNPMYALLVGPSCQGLYAYSCALGIVSAIVIGVYLLLFMVIRDKLPEKALYWTSIFLFLWWVAGVGATTFQTNVALITGTAYFASWGSLFFAGMIMYSEHQQFRSMVDTVTHLEHGGQSTFYMLLASLVETVSAIQPCASGPCSSNDVFALILGIISFILCLILLRVESAKLAGADRMLSCFLVVWWCVRPPPPPPAVAKSGVLAGIVLTIRAPFGVTNRTIGMGVVTISGPFQFGVGNGFFASWVAFLSSFFTAQVRVFGVQDATF